MRLIWDETKNAANRKKHGIAFATAVDFDWSTATTSLDKRRDYGETRFIGVGYIDSRLHVLIYTRRQETIRIISLRKANDRELGNYEQQTS